MALVLALHLLSGQAAWGAAQELTVSAAASLANAFSEIGHRFENLHSETKVIFNFAASGALLQQISQGAPVDVFAAADQQTMNRAQEQRLIVPASRKNFVCNRLVLIAPHGRKLTLSGLGDLELPLVKRVALGNPATVPAGRYAQEGLIRAGLWETLQPKLIFGASVRQVLDYVSRGEVEAGFVFSTDAAIVPGKVKILAEIKMQQAIVYPVALVAASPKQDLGQQFLNFLSSPEGMAIFEKYGFVRP
jgi:molybdate transport system substrate-binding protein